MKMNLKLADYKELSDLASLSNTQDEKTKEAKCSVSPDVTPPLVAGGSKPNTHYETHTRNRELGRACAKLILFQCVVFGTSSIHAQAGHA